MRVSPILLLAAAMAACQPEAKPAAPDQTSAPSPVAAMAAPNCNAGADGEWAARKAADGETAFTVEARAFGPSCANAVVLLAIRDQGGAPVYTWSARTQDVFGLMDAADPGAMKTALAEWIDQATAAYPTSDRLPDWPRGAPTPMAGEFPFYPAEGVDRDGYLAVRKQALPMLCFPQGHESSDCIFLRDGVLESLGLQTFPG